MSKILITGANGMLGSYLRDAFEEHEIFTLGLKPENDFVCDLREDKPDLKNYEFDTVIHCAGTEEDTDARILNYAGTVHLFESLEGCMPQHFVYISSHQVYGDSNENKVKEDDNLWAVTEAGKTKALAEKYLIDITAGTNIVLTIIRPARLFGSGVKGKMLELFNDAVSGRYIHIRGNDAKISIATAYDAARGIKALYKNGGIYNVSDCSESRLIELVESMTANAGGKKRMTHLPLAWAEWIWRLGRWAPAINRNLHPEVVEKRMKTLLLDGSKFAEKAGIEYFNTLQVIERNAEGYPYKD